METTFDMLRQVVAVVTAAKDGARRGLAVAWSTQVAPDSILVCVGQQSATREWILETGAFGYNMLRSDQLELARRFGLQSSAKVDKFEGLETYTAETGAPLLKDCLESLDCRVETVFDLHTHKLIVGKVAARDAHAADAQPLIYRQADYH